MASEGIFQTEKNLKIMAFQNFLDRLIAGDVRSFVVLCLLALFIFVIYRYVQNVIHPYRGYIKFIAVLLVGLAIYTWIVYPDRIADIFNAVVDWITVRIEPLIAGEDTELLD